MEVSGRRPIGNDGRKSGLICDPCKGEDEDEPAESYCTVCNEYLCYGCGKAHARAKATKNHPLLDQGSMPKQKPTSDKDNICQKHIDKAIEYYCKKHDTFCCAVCATINHKQCSVRYIDEITTDFHMSNEYIALEKAISNLIRLLQGTKSTATRNMTDLESIHANFISDLHHFRTEINNKLDSLEKAAMREAQILRDSERKTVQSIDTRCNSMLSDIHSLSSKLAELKKYKQGRQLMICCKTATATAKTCGVRANTFSEQNKIKDYKFQPNEKIRRFFDSLDSLGQIKERKDERETNSQTTCPDVSAQTSHQPTASYGGNIDVRHSTDKHSCWITGGVLIDETTLAFTDHSNFSVKVVDVKRNTVLTCIKLPTQPWNITFVNREQIVVTCSDEIQGKLVFLKYGKSLSVLKELNIGQNCHGVVYSNNTLIVSFGHPESFVKIFDMNGKVLKTLKTNKAGGALFSNPWYISLSTNQQTVFVSDGSNDTVTSLSLDGIVRHVYTADSLNGPHGLAVDRNDIVYIAGHWSHNIHQLSIQGNRSQVILDKTRAVEGPWMVTYCKTQHRLYISGRKNGFHGVFVYQLHT